MALFLTRFEEAGNALVKKYKTRDPFEIAENHGIAIYEADFGKLKGMYRVIKKRRCIFLNASLDERTAKIVCAHELGHDMLHRDFAKGNGLQEFMIYEMNSRREYEANMVAATILLPDDEILEYIYEYKYDAVQIAGVMKSDINLVALKVAHLQANGYKLRSLEHNSKFLK